MNLRLDQDRHWQKTFLRNLAVPALIERAVAAGEGVLVASGALAVWTGQYTGRSPQDRFLVRHGESERNIEWGPVNQPIEPEAFDRLEARVREYLLNKEDIYCFDGFAGADPRYRLPVRVINEYAWQNLFIRQLLRRPAPDELETFEPEFTLICAPGCSADPSVDPVRSEAFILLDLERKRGVIGGTHYAGEMKKLIFTVMNYLLPASGVLPMHCGANIGPDGDVACFFGLSGTGKTTLSSDPTRRLIGDDEHGWSDQGIFNIEGGCYAKTIGLSRDKEPQIWDAIRFGAILENVVIDEKTRETDYSSDRYTENTRAAYPLSHIPEATREGTAGHPRTVIFLTADASGVLPPIAKLDTEQAMYHFLTGYTSKLAGTERGISEPQPVFSACFGAPFLPRPPAVYARLLGERLKKHGTRVFLVNTGWTGGPIGQGQRIDLALTREMVRAALRGDLDEGPYRVDPVFRFRVPLRCPGVPDNVLDPKSTWSDPEAYDQRAKALAAEFRENIARLDGVDASIREAGPVG